MQRDARQPAGFTLAELMIVIFILGLLTAILIPVVSSALATANRVAQQSQLNSIRAASESYHQTFDAYPGYFNESTVHDDDQLTSTESLVLSLMGRVNLQGEGTQIGGTGRHFRENDIGAGPMTRSGRTYGSFYSPNQEEIGYALNRSGNSRIGGPLPELVDVSNGLPILYFRSRGGSARRPVSYDFGDGHYTVANNEAYLNAEIRSNEDEQDIFSQNAGSMGSLLNSSVTSPSEAANNLAWFAINGQLSDISASGNGAANNNGRDVLRGKFMLMSAGEDGIYVGAEQAGGGSTVRSGDASREDAIGRFDDVVVSGG